MNSKICSKCKQEKNFSLFHKSKTGKFGYKNYCKECSAIARKDLYDENKEEEIAKARAWQENNKEKYLEYQKNYFLNTKK